MGGAKLWTSLEDNISFVLTHPNGWEGSQQGKMRDAAVMAGLVPDTPEGHERVHFVTEGEANIHYCVQSGLLGGGDEVCALIPMPPLLFPEVLNTILFQGQTRDYDR